jgi:parallel beta-helix repeat protein
VRNYVTSSITVGIHIRSSSNNIISGNNVSNNRIGIDLESSSNNSVFHNNFIDNVVQAGDDTESNLWNDTYPSGGNYWSDWSPICQDWYNGSATPQATGSSDGICDFNYTIDANSKDFYPLKEPWTLPLDTDPPIIVNLQPPDASITDDTTPIISADYNDPSGINISSVLLRVDGIDVTLFPSTSVTATGIAYAPVTGLSETIHTVYLEVDDTVGNKATASWSFTVDSTPPTIEAFGAVPSPQEVGGIVNISATITDNSGIVSTVSLAVRDPSTGLLYNLSMAESGNIYYIENVYGLPVGTYSFAIWANDINNNWASVAGTFIIQDTTAPLITNLQPPHNSIIHENAPTICANYSDISGINVSSVVLKVDGVDVTSSASTTSSGIIYTLTTALPEGNHTVYLRVRDTNGNPAIAIWNFAIDASASNTTPPNDFLKEYWWLLLFLVIVIVLLLVLIIFRIKRKKSSAEEIADND